MFLIPQVTGRSQNFLLRF